MAPLTWRNVDAPDLGRAAEILNGAVRNFSMGFDGLGDTADRVRRIQKENRSAGAVPILAGVGNSGQVDAALAQVNGMIAPQDMTAELQKQVLDLRGTTAQTDRWRAGTDAVRGQEGRAATEFGRRIEAEDQLNAIAKDYLSGYENSKFSVAGGASGGSPTAGGPYNDREILARTIQAEAGGEGPGGMLAVGAVIGNRVKSGKYGGNVREVIMAPGQFSAWNGVTGYADGQGAINMDGVRPSDHAYAAADAILSGNYQDPTNGAVNYYNPNAADPAWGAKAGGQWTQIGNHVFGGAAGGSGIPYVRPTAVAPMVLPGSQNKIPLSTLMEMVNNNYAAMTGAEDRRREDVTYTRNEAEWARGEEDRVIAEEANNRLYDEILPGITSVDEGKRNVAQRNDLSPKEKAALYGLLDKVGTDNPAYFTTDAPVASNPEYDRILSDLKAEQAVASATDPNAALIEALTKTDAGSPAGAATGTGEGGGSAGSGGGGGNLPSLYDTWVDMKKKATDAGVELGIDDGSFMDGISAVAEKTGVDPRLVAQVAKNHFSSRAFGWGSANPDWTSLENAVTESVSSARTSLDARNTAQQGIGTVSSLIGEAAQLQKEIATLRERNKPGANAAINNKQARLDQIDAQIRTFAMEDPKAPETQTDGGTTGTGTGNGTRDIEAEIAAERAKLAEQAKAAESIPTPQGNKVDPKASAAAQDWQRMWRQSEIQQTVRSIGDTVALDGGSPAARMIGSITDYMNLSPEAGKAAQQSREIKADALSWYRSPEAIDFFKANPQALAEAQQDPVGFYLKAQKK